MMVVAMRVYTAFREKNLRTRFGLSKRLKNTACQNDVTSAVVPKRCDFPKHSVPKRCDFRSPKTMWLPHCRYLRLSFTKKPVVLKEGGVWVNRLNWHLKKTSLTRNRENSKLTARFQWGGETEKSWETSLSEVITEPEIRSGLRPESTILPEEDWEWELWIKTGAGRKFQFSQETDN